MKTNTEKNPKSELLSRPEPLSTQPGRQIDFSRRKANRSLDTEKLLALLESEAPSLFKLAEVVGKWVWIQFTEKQPAAITRILAELGFHWNRTRRAWQHPCGVYGKERSNRDPRQRYGSYYPAAKAVTMKSVPQYQSPQLSVKLTVKILNWAQKILTKLGGKILDLPLKLPVLPLI